MDLFEQPEGNWSFVVSGQRSHAIGHLIRTWEHRGDVDSDAAVPLWSVPKGAARSVGHTHRAALSDLLQVPADDPSRLSGPDRSSPLPPLRRGSPAIVEPLAC